MIRMWCGSCGKERTVAVTAGDPGPCSCGSSLRQSVPPRKGYVAFEEFGIGAPPTPFLRPAVDAVLDRLT